jgi:membrane fusion protein, copper/silver efflux system
MKQIITITICCFLLVACGNKKQQNIVADEVYYTCSMDPQVVEAKPGKCPICHMQLTPVSKKNQEAANELQLSPEQILLGNIHVDTLRDGVFSNQTILTGTLTFNELTTNATSARIGGRIEKLYFKNTGDYIHAGDKLFDLYSEELNNAKQEFLLAVEKQKKLGNTLIDYKSLIESSRNKLVLWGMSEKQIDDLKLAEKASPVTTFYATASGTVTDLPVKEGDYVMEGGTIVKLADMSTLWAEAQVYTSRLSHLDKNSKALVQIPDIAGKTIEGKIDFINPEINPDTRINLIRINVPNHDGTLKPGMPVYVTIKDPQQKMLSLPVDAVLRDGKEAIVWTKISANKFASKIVETGIEAEGMIEITSGLQDGDVIVINGAYLLQSENVFRK